MILGGIPLDINTSEVRSVGYTYLLEKFELNRISHWHRSYISTATVCRSKHQDGDVEDIYPDSYWPGDYIGNHLEFALKYDGVNFGYLAAIFERVEERDIVQYIQSKPTGKYARRIWFFYEFLTEKTLAVADLTQGNYIEALESDRYYVVTTGERVQRQRIINNLLGDEKFCPLVRRTDPLKKMELIDLHKRCENIVAAYPETLLRRALSYLYNKETKSSFEIEHIKPNASRTEAFITLLQLAEQQDFCTKKCLIDLQNRIVDPRFKNINYRSNQNYVGQTVSYQREIMHYISPKPNDIVDLMEGLINSHLRMKKTNLFPLVHAAVCAYGFVFLHPFEDGNGRIHRFLIHNILSIQGMVPKGLMFPVSAIMLKNLMAYDRSLEAFSKPLMQHIEYLLNDVGEMEVLNDTRHYYRYIDMTPQVEALYDFVEQTIEHELVEELDFLVHYDETKKAIQHIIDMPDRLIDLFIRVCLENNGKLSERKKKSHFKFLEDEEVVLMEKAFKERYQDHL